MDYIVGCDVGTTSVKAVAFGLTGDILASESASYPMIHPEPGYAEQDPDAIFDQFMLVLEKLISGLDHNPLGVVLSSAMHSLMALDSAGKPSSPLIIWADNRSGALADALRKSAAGREQYKRTGVPIHAMTPACKLLWINRHQTAGLYKAWKYAGIKDYLIFRLTGELITDYSMAAAMGLLNLESLAWDKETLRSLDIREDQLPEIVSPYHTLTVLEDEELAFLTGIPFIAGGSDGCLANLGSGAGSPETLALTIGTSGAVRRTSQNRYLDEQMRTFCYPLDTDMFIIGGPTNNGGIVFQWLKDSFFADKSYEEMVAAAAEVPPGAEGLYFLPYLLGERAPLWDAAVRGCFHGIDITHTRAHFARAVMEGVMMNLYVIGQVLLENTKVHTLYANGGFAQSREYVGMLADIFGINVALNETNDAGCIGAALIGLRALDRIADFSDIDGFVKVSEVVAFDPDRHEVYKRIFSGFCKLLESMPLRPARDN